jgi:hypothetical protein
MRSVAFARPPLTRPRRLVAAALCVLVQAFVLASPLVHAHPDDHDEDHEHGSAVHAHLGGHDHDHAHEDADEENGPGFEQEHERAVYLPLFISEPQTVFDLPAAAPQAFVVNAPDEATGHLSVAVSHGHDPPLVSSTPPRAPPVHPAFI